MVHASDQDPSGACCKRAEYGAKETPADGHGRVARRALLRAGLAGAALPLIAGCAEPERAANKPGLSFNAGWLFGGAYQPRAELADFDDSAFTPVTVPHTAAHTPLSWRDWDPAAWQDVWIYRRHFDVSSLVSALRGQRVFARFDGVMVNATVVCNDQVMASHRGGYLPFSAELTDALRPGENVLAVVVDARCIAVPPVPAGSDPASIDFMQPAGIYRDVSVLVVPRAFISDLSATPADVLTARPRVDVRCTIDTARPVTGRATLLAELLDGEARPIASQILPLDISGSGLSSASLSLTGFGPARLWSPDSPALYTVRARLTVPGAGAHEATRRIGFRDAAFRPDGFYLNGQRLQLFGLDRHQMFPYAGMAMPARVQRRDAEILRNELNCNMVRCSHYPQSPHFLDACDELGLMVWEEAPGWGHVSPDVAWQDLVVENVRDMVTRDRSHPSVIIWGTRLNETRGYPALWAATREAARALDPSRPSAGAMHVHNPVEWAEDVFAFNDYSVTRQGAARLAPPVPGVPYLITESVGVMETRPPHFAWTDPPEMLARQADLHAQAHSAAGESTAYAGLLGWAGFDYHSLLGRPYSVKWAGVADGFRVPKPGAAIYQAQVDPKVRPVIIPVFFWGPGGSSAAGGASGASGAVLGDAMIASNCERLEIAVEGGPSMTALPSDAPRYRNLPYPPFFVTMPPASGDLVIAGYAGGRAVAELRMSADPAFDRLAIAADDEAIAADGSDATRVVFRAVDAYGNQRRYLTGEVTLALAGPGTLLGDNPFEFGAYGGLGAVWVRSLPGQPGVIAIAAEHPVLGQAAVQVRATA
ncbi:MAG TPA: glycoside hydrolase family 2 TIM barrel-domain containing protein [Streptosporangiaceae bacterium]|nr:glycoside hydrolase family 2 TIM barrel-domain containing protein [Streptosporangiaceae bacterium]